MFHDEFYNMANFDAVPIPHEERGGIVYISDHDIRTSDVSAQKTIAAHG
jgi:hypothetical protein